MFKQSVLAMAVAGLLVAGSASADTVTIDVAGAGGTGFLGGPTVTDPIEELQFYAETLSVQYDTNGNLVADTGDKFVDSGHANITAFLPSGTYGAGIGTPLSGLGAVLALLGFPAAGPGDTTWAELTVAWSGLTGTLTGTGVPNGFGGLDFQQIYDAGTTFTFYYDGGVTTPGANIYGNADFNDVEPGSSDDSGMTDGVIVMTLLITGGEGNLSFDGDGAFVTGSSNLIGTVTSVESGFWAINGVPFEDLLGAALSIGFEIDQNVNDVFSTPGGVAGPDGFGAPLFTVASNHDGSMKPIRVSVPVPGTLGLLGSALLALGGMCFARSRKV